MLHRSVFISSIKATIKQENIYAPLKIVLSDKAEILDYKILKVARLVSGMQLTRDTLDKNLGIDFKALEQHDGFVGQIIFEGNKNVTIHLEGGMDGEKHFETQLSTVDPVYLVIAIVIFLMAAYIFLFLSRRNPKNSLWLIYVFSAIPILYLLLMLYKTEWFVGHIVPES